MKGKVRSDSLYTVLGGFRHSSPGGVIIGFVKACRACKACHSGFMPQMLHLAGGDEETNGGGVPVLFCVSNGLQVHVLEMLTSK